MDISQIAQRMQQGVSHRPIDGSLKFDCGDEGVIVLAGDAVGRDDRATDCTIKISLANLGKLVSGKLNPMTGVVTGKLKVSGDTRVALKLGELLKR